MVSRETSRASAEPLVFDGMRAIIVVGLGVGAVLGFGGNFFEPGNAQNVLYGLSALGLILASVLLAVQHASVGNRLAAAGFALLALGEARLLNPTDVPGGEASFAAGVLIYAPGLLMIALSSWAPRWIRLVGAIAAIPFAAHSLIYLSGGAIDSKDPLAGIGYTLFTVAVIGWMITVLRSEKAAPARNPRELLGTR
ncbi:MAG: hypothetical protein ACRDJV_12650 [Actinomycetota bacterium]